MKQTTALPAYKDLQPFSQPPGIVTAAVDDLTNLVALAGPTMTHSEVFIEGTEPFPPIQEEPTEVALGMQGQDETAFGGKGSLLRADAIVLISDAQGHKLYINTGASVSSGSSRGPRPLGPTQPSAP